MSPVSAVDVFHDMQGRPYAAGWRFDPRRPLEVQLHLSAGAGVTQVWCFARDWLAPEAVGAGGDIAVLASGERLVVALYPLTARAKTLTGSAAVALEFLVATEALGWVGRIACLAHVATYTAVTAGVVVGLWVVLGLAITPLELDPLARTPDLRWLRPPGRMSSCLHLTLLSSVVERSS